MTWLLASLAMAGGPTVVTSPHAAPTRREIGSATVRYAGRAVAVVDGSGWCALRLSDQWVPFSAAGGPEVGLELDASTPVVLSTWAAPADVWGAAVVLELLPAEPRAGALTEVTLAPTTRGVPYFLADYAGRACHPSTPEHQANLARIAELPDGARRYLVELLSLAALSTYEWSGAPSASDAPASAIPLFARRCVRRRDCTSWAAGVARGLRPISPRRGPPSARPPRP